MGPALLCAPWAQPWGCAWYGAPAGLGSAQEGLAPVGAGAAVQGQGLCGVGRGRGPSFQTPLAPPQAWRWGAELLQGLPTSP